MQINGNEVMISLLEIDTIEDEMVAYNAKDNKIITFNKMASFIWSIIMEMENTEVNVTTKQITEKIFKTFHIKEIEEKEVYADVDDILNQFIDANLIKRKA